MLNIAVFISGGGTNLQAIINAVKENKINGKIKLVFSNRKNAYGLIRAQNESIDTFYFFLLSVVSIFYSSFVTLIGENSDWAVTSVQVSSAEFPRSATRWGSLQSNKQLSAGRGRRSGIPAPFQNFLSVTQCLVGPLENIRH